MFSGSAGDVLASPLSFKADLHRANMRMSMKVHVEKKKDVGEVNMRGHMAVIRAPFHSRGKGKGIYVTEVCGIINRTEKRKKMVASFYPHCKIPARRHTH